MYRYIDIDTIKMRIILQTLLINILSSKNKSCDLRNIQH